jgi:hypothetical protein
MRLMNGELQMKSYFSVPGMDTGVHSTANSADVEGNVRVRLAIGGEAGILVEEDAPLDVAPSFVAIYFQADDLGVLIHHLQAMQNEYTARGQNGV